MITMEDKLQNIFCFLSNNRQYNQALQYQIYKNILSPYDSTKEKVISLLYHCGNAQSQPKIDRLAGFYKEIIPKDNDCFTSCLNFISSLNQNNQVTNVLFDDLYSGLKNQPGFGKKTSALFTKIIYQIHNDKFFKDFKIWDDVPNTIGENVKFYLPVDTVIISIFEKIDIKKSWNFDEINCYLNNNGHSYPDLLVWDDLWYWGYITQQGTGNNRKFGWNENKYWTFKESDKNPKLIQEIRQKAMCFLSLVYDEI